jgi:hypothetical protein
VEAIGLKHQDATRRTVIDNMAPHPSARDTGEFEVTWQIKEAPEQVQIRVEYFQIQGDADLRLELEKVE